MRPSTLAASILLVAASAPAAQAQFAAVPAPPPRAVRANEPVPGDSAALDAKRDTVKEVQRLDIQAWVDSAAGALARTPPADTTGRRGDAPKRGTPPAARPAPAAPPRDSVARPGPPR